MNLEQRVEDLEMEVEILKAQIQVTLLSIQEQLLNHAYPALRAEESPRPTASMSTSEMQEAQAAGAQPVQRVAVAHVTTSEFEPLAEQEVPIVRKRQLYEEPQAAAPTPAPQPPMYTPAPTPVSPSSTMLNTEERESWADAVTNPRDASSRDWIELENWVSQKVEILGISRTRELINLYARQERFSTQECELLLQFVDIYDDSAVKSPSAYTLTPPNKAANGRAPHPEVDIRPSIVPQTRAVVDEIRTELRKKNAQNHAHHEEPTEMLSEQQGLVLRLIAGILNAGDTPPASSNGRRKR